MPDSHYECKLLLLFHFQGCVIIDPCFAVFEQALSLEDPLNRMIMVEYSTEGKFLMTCQLSSDGIELASHWLSQVPG